MSNKRTFWACEGMGLAVHGAGTTSPAAFTFVPGVQSVGMSTNFNLEQIFQLGQLEIYQDLEEVPDVELTVERAMDQNALLYNRGLDENAHATVTIVDDQNNRVDVGFEIGDSEIANIGDGNGLAFAYMSGMFVSSASFNFGTDGFFTESISLVGNHKVWTAVAGAVDFIGAPTAAALDTGNVAKRQKFYFKDPGLPAPILGLGAGGLAGDIAVNSVSVSVDFGREEIQTLGHRQPYHRYVTFPVEVTCDIEAYVTDVVDLGVKAHPDDDNTTEQTIHFAVTDLAVADVKNIGGAADLHAFNLGTKNRLQSVTWNGVDTGGTNATITYSYRNFNVLSITTVANKTS
jgi:hypothetical protein